MHETTQNDLFYNIDDIRNLFLGEKNEKYWCGHAIKRFVPLWTKEYPPRLSFFTKITDDD